MKLLPIIILTLSTQTACSTLSFNKEKDSTQSADKAVAKAETPTPKTTTSEEKKAEPANNTPEKPLADQAELEKPENKTDKTDTPTKTTEDEEESPQDGLSIGLKAGSLGIGYEAAKPLNRFFDLRIGTTQGRANGSLNVQHIHYAAGFESDTVMAAIDIHPTKGGFYLSGGGMLNNNKITLSNKPNKLNSVKIGNTLVTKGRIDAEVTFTDITPYAGFGYRSPIAKEKGLTFTSEVGLLYQGQPKVNLSVTSLDENDPNIHQEEQSMENDLSFLQYWPVISLGLAYNF